MRSILLSLLLLSLNAVATSAAEVDYSDDVLPVLQKYCIGCHTEDEAQGGLVMETHAALMKGGETGVAITAGQPGSSRLMQMTLGKLDPRMPPEDEAQPTEDELALLADWIEAGAVGPDGVSAIQRKLRTPKIATNQSVKAPVTAVAHSVDGALRAFAHFGRVVIETVDGKAVATISQQPGKVNSLMFSRDGDRILVGSGLTGAYGRAAVYATKTGTLQAEYVGHNDTLYAAVFSPDESQVATAGYDRDIILWDTRTGEPIREFNGHNGAIFDLAFSPDGEILVSACADETVKIWQVDTGQRLDTLNQPEGEVFAVAVTADGKFIVAGSADNRLRVWRLLSRKTERINPIVATRFVDETSIVNFEFTPDGKAVVVLSSGGNIKMMRTSDWNQAAVLDPLGETPSSMSIASDGESVMIALMNGEIAERELPALSTVKVGGDAQITPVYWELDELTELDEATLRSEQTINQSGVLSVGRGVVVSGAIMNPAAADLYQWQAIAGEVWAIDCDRVDKSVVDPIVTILDASLNPVLQTRLQAVRDSYFTFRGKNSKQVSDFRIFNWQEMNLSQYLYSAGEVTRLWMHPRGPDSGFNVYPGEGDRWTYFGTTHATHALGEPAYVVEPLAAGQEPLANGLPVFDLYYENDDDPMRDHGVDSRLLFTAPADGLYTVRVSDTRGDGGGNHAYQLRIRPAKPDFEASITPVKSGLRRGTGREFEVKVKRVDGFDGPVTFEIPDLPRQIKANVPLVVEAGQGFATGNAWVAADVEAWTETLNPSVIAWANVNGRRIERKAGKLGELKLLERAQVIPSIRPLDRDTPTDESWTLQVRRGETVSARLVIDRQDGFDKEVSFGKEKSGRNATQGVYVDNIGLSGLLVLKDATEREFFLTADITAVPGKRSFFLTANVEGNVTSHPITVEVLP